MPLPSASGPIQNEEQQCVLLIRAVTISLPFLFISVLKSGPFIEHLESSYLKDSEVDGMMLFLN